MTGEPTTEINVIVPGVGVVPMICKAESIEAVHEFFETHGYLDGINPDGGVRGRFYPAGVGAIIERNRGAIARTSSLVVPRRN